MIKIQGFIFWEFLKLAFRNYKYKINQIIINFYMSFEESQKWFFGYLIDYFTIIFR